MDSAAAEQLKTAIANSDFAEAQRLIPAYRDQVVSLLSSARTNKEREDVMESFHNLLSLARVTRAHISAHLAAVNRDACYRVHIPERHSWHFEG